MHPAAQSVVRLALKPGEPRRCFVLGQVPHPEMQPPEVRLLTESGFLPATLNETCLKQLLSTGSVSTEAVSLETAGKPLCHPSVWIMARGSPALAKASAVLDHTLQVVGKVHVGQLLAAVALLTDFPELGGVLDFSDLFHKLSWKSFVLHCWIEAASRRIEKVCGPTWQASLAQCHEELLSMVGDMGEGARKEVFRTIVTRHFRSGRAAENEEVGSEPSGGTPDDNGGVYSRDTAHECARLSHPHVSLARAKEIFYSALLGYSPPEGFLPKNIDMAKALSRGLPPPLCPSIGLWDFFRVTPPSPGQRLVTINFCTPSSPGRHFAAIGASSLNDFLASVDVSAGEVLSDDLRVTALTFDLDGKTVDAQIDPPESVYPPDLVVQDLLDLTRAEALESTDGRWDPFKNRPAVHIWRSSGPGTDKLSMRVSLHLPPNVTFASLDAARVFFQNLAARARSTRPRYLTVSSVEVDGSKRFEQSVTLPGEWHCIEDTARVSLEEYIRRNTAVGSAVLIRCDGAAFTVSKHPLNLGYSVAGSDSRTVLDLYSWLCCAVARHAFVQCFVDEGIYTNNHSVRLPEQSKIVDGCHVRKFVAHSRESTPVDALVHFPHTDTPPIPGPPIAMGCPKKPPPAEKSGPSPHSEEDMNFVKNFISASHEMQVEKVMQQPRSSCSYIYVSHPADSGSSRWCLIKEGVHTSARMYLVYDWSERTLRASCWSSRCREKLRTLNDRRGVVLCRLSGRRLLGRVDHDLSMDVDGAVGKVV